MSWRERLQPASFRGVEFFIDGASGQGGRRVALHEYPQQEQHYAEDLGKVAGSQRLQAFVIGADYDLARDRLFAELDKPGAGTLVHPYLGTMRIQIQSYEWTISTREGGVCKVVISYVLAGKRQYPSDSQSNVRTLQAACTAAQTAVQESFADQHSVAGFPQFVTEASISMLGRALSTLRRINGQLSAAMQPLSDLANDIDQLGSEIATLILMPRTLAMHVAGVFTSAMGAFYDIKGAFSGYKSLLAGFGIVDPVPTTTKSRRRQAANQAAISNLLAAVVTIELARNIATTSTPFTTYEQAIEVRDALLQQLDDLIETGTDAEYAALVALQTALMRRVDDVAPGLQKIEQIQLTHSVPALVLAHQLYGDASQADELVARNGVSHPLFMPAGIDLEVLT